MSRYIPEKLKMRVIQEANACCEYCLQSNLFSFYPHQIDHIISLKHGGETILANLAYACFACNNAKGSDIGTMLLPERTFVRLYNPRTDNWHDHFEMVSGFICDKTDIGKATIKVLNLNEIERIIERQE
jgi:5-methylcytosine-specific restriction endonuclease McrA